MAGEHGMWNKSCFYEGSARVPMIVSWPGRIEPGRRIGQVVSLLDLVRTLLDIAGDDTGDLPGASLAGVLDGQRPGERRGKRSPSTPRTATTFPAA